MNVLYTFIQECQPAELCQHLSMMTVGEQTSVESIGEGPVPGTHFTIVSPQQGTANITPQTPQVYTYYMVNAQNIVILEILI